MHPKFSAHYTNNERFAFVSYSYRNYDIAQKVVKKLETRGITVWYDGGMEIGPDWTDLISNQISRCSVLVVLFSNDYLKSKFCNHELIFAASISKTIIPVFLE